jgi:hypothetical protein
MIPSPPAGRALLRRLALAAVLASALAPGLAGCGLYQPVSQADREAMASCRTEADRVYAARNRYLLSERDQTSTPQSGSYLGGNPAAGLSDQYEQKQLIDTCVARSAAGEPAKP